MTIFLSFLWRVILVGAVAAIPSGCASSAVRMAKTGSDDATLGLMIAPGSLRSSEVTLIWSKPALPEVATGWEYVVSIDGRTAGRTAQTHWS